MYRQKRYRRRSGVVGLQAVVLASVLGALVLAGVLYGCAQARGTGGDGEAPENPAGVAGKDAVADQETGGAGEEPVAPSDSADGDEAAAEPYDFSQSVPEREAVEDSYFDDAVFIGNSITEGFMLYGGPVGAAYMTDIGLMVDTVFTDQCVAVGEEKRTVMEALEETEGVLRPRLSRRRAQRAALDALLEELRPGDIIPACVTHLEPFGAFVDIGCGVPSLIGIENISVSRISHPGQRFRVGQSVFAAVLELDRRLERVYLTHRELLGTWAENAARFQPGMTVPGVVRGVKDYGIFVELTPNLSGLAERREGLAEGQRLSVYIKSILPQRMKLKLLVIDTLPPLEGPPPLEYFLTRGRLEHWKYAPPGCVKVGAETVFA